MLHPSKLLKDTAGREAKGLKLTLRAFAATPSIRGRDMNTVGESTLDIIFGGASMLDITLIVLFVWY